LAIYHAPGLDVVGVAGYGLPASDWSYGYARSFSRRASAFDRFDFEHLKMLDTLEKWRMAASCTIITGEPNELVREIHSRVPVILPEEYHDAWLSAEAGKEILVPCPAIHMKSWSISPRVNSPRNNDPRPPRKFSHLFRFRSIVDTTGFG
jgi:hypothetical protein